MYLENMIFYTFDGFFSIAHIHIVFIVFCSSSKNRAACPPSICTWWNWKEMGKVVLSQHTFLLRAAGHTASAGLHRQVVGIDHLYCITSFFCLFPHDAKHLRNQPPLPRTTVYD